VRYTLVARIVPGVHTDVPQPSTSILEHTKQVVSVQGVMFKFYKSRLTPECFQGLSWLPCLEFSTAIGSTLQASTVVAPSFPWLKPCIELVQCYRSLFVPVDQRVFVNHELAKNLNRSLKDFMPSSENDPEQKLLEEVSTQLVQHSAADLTLFSRFNALFDRTMDEQLVSAVGNWISSSKPDDWTTLNLDESKLAKYPELEKVWKISKWAVRTRWAVIVKVNTLLLSSLSFVPFHDDDSELTRAFNNLKHLLCFDLKCDLLNKSVKLAERCWSDQKMSLGRSVDIYTPTAQAKVDADFHQTLFYHIVKHVQQPTNFEAWRTLPGISSFSQMFQVVCSELHSSAPLFVPCTNQVRKEGSCQDCFVPASALAGDSASALYELVGQLMGVGMLVEEVLPLKLPPIIWKLLVGLTPEENDIRQFDEVAFKLIQDVRLLSDRQRNDELTQFTFCVRGSDGKLKPLVEDGANKPVMGCDLKKFADLVLDYHLHEFDAFCAAIRRGLLAMVPSFCYLDLMSWQELQLKMETSLFRRSSSTSSEQIKTEKRLREYPL